MKVNFSKLQSKLLKILFLQSEKTKAMLTTVIKKVKMYKSLVQIWNKFEKNK